MSTIWHRILKLINRKSENDNSDIEPKTIGYGKSDIGRIVNRNLQNRKLWNRKSDIVKLKIRFREIEQRDLKSTNLWTSNIKAYKSDILKTTNWNRMWDHWIWEIEIRNIGILNMSECRCSFRRFSSEILFFCSSTLQAPIVLFLICVFRVWFRNRNQFWFWCSMLRERYFGFEIKTNFVFDFQCCDKDILVSI